MSTDEDWERWGRQDPYFGIITDERFRTGKIDERARAEFFASGEAHAAGVIQACRRLFGQDFTPRRTLDFGCGVGRVAIPLSAVSDLVVGVDVSRAMLDEAERNCALYDVHNVVLLSSDDELSQVRGEFDLVHSAITFQHIEVPRGRRIFARLIEKLAPGGIGAIQLTYAKAYHADTFGQPPPVALAATAVQSAARPLGRLLRTGGRGDDDDSAGAAPRGDPLMLMNPYPLSDLAFLMQRSGVPRFHAEFTDHGGELGVFLFFQKPAA